MLAWILLILINLYMLRIVTNEGYIYIQDKDTGKMIRIKPGPSGYDEV